MLLDLKEGWPPSLGDAGGVRGYSAAGAAEIASGLRLGLSRQSGSLRGSGVGLERGAWSGPGLAPQFPAVMLDDLAG